MADLDGPGNEEWQPDLDALDPVERDTQEPDLDEPEGAEPAVPWYVGFVPWVQNHLARVEYFTPDAKIRWCPEWWEHPEVVERFRALWLSHQAVEFSLELGALSHWWIYDWEPHRSILFHDKGPFRNCDVEHGHLWQTDKKVSPLAATPPAEWEPQE